MKMIKKTIDIAAGADKIWPVLTEDQFNQQWFAEFSNGTKAESDWKQGSRIEFKDESGSGIGGKIEQLVPNEYLSIGYDSILKDGKPDTDSPWADAVVGMHENYRLTSKGGNTELYIESDMDEENFDKMSASWDRALAKIKTLAEN
ncbi:MAG: SRPBCC domain-containing protein [Gemmatimonadaceae bacterium]|nr:SRPBCC domain-containing protein [Chitinophagaceae bacterium]